MGKMLILACLRHWYSSAIFFGPVPLIGLFVWVKGRRDRTGGRDDVARPHL